MNERMVQAIEVALPAGFPPKVLERESGYSKIELVGPHTTRAPGEKYHALILTGKPPTAAKRVDLPDLTQPTEIASWIEKEVQELFKFAGELNASN